MPNQQNQDAQYGNPAKNQADGKFDQNVSTDDTDTSGEAYSKNLMSTTAEGQVRENEDASLQDDSYSFDSDNLGDEDIHDTGDFEDDEGVHESDMQ